LVAHEQEAESLPTGEPSSSCRGVSYLDTQAAVWLAQRDFKRIRLRAKEQIPYSCLWISPLVAVEMEFLLEIGRMVMGEVEVRLVLHADFGISLCDLDLTAIMKAALTDKWTRGPFDRPMVAHAKVYDFDR
jgi:PIN domain nuclease of toxin-antitoxin system